MYYYIGLTLNFYWLMVIGSLRQPGTKPSSVAADKRFLMEKHNNIFCPDLRMKFRPSCSVIAFAITLTFTIFKMYLKSFKILCLDDNYPSKWLPSQLKSLAPLTFYLPQSSNIIKMLISSHNFSSNTSPLNVQKSFINNSLKEIIFSRLNLRSY